MILLAWGCAPSPLIRKDDPIYRHSLSRLSSDLGMLSGFGSPDSLHGKPVMREPDPLEEALFLQAEAFYHYRLEMRSPGALSMTTQALAASTDFAPLSVWAASSEINQLRMLSYNGAVQLYEDFLSRYPESPLAPLVLYRLGWAYRSISIRGFPGNPRQPLEVILNRFPQSPLAPFAKELLTIPFKTQENAAAWSIIPGAGQIYIGETANGMVRFSIAAAFASAALLPPIFMIKNRQLDWPGLLLSATGFIGLQVSYTFAFQDAQRGAVLFNEAKEKGFEERHPNAP